MVRLRDLLVLAISAFVLASGPTQAQFDPARDLPGAKDHPMVPRYEGSVIFGYKFERFAEANMPLGPAVRTVENKRGFAKVETIEGARTRILYVAPLQRTSVEVIRNYRAALEAKGFYTVYECRGDDCGVQIEEALYGYRAERKITDSQVMEYAFTMGVEEPRLWVGRLDRREGPLWVMVFAAFSGNAADARAGNRVQVLVDVLDKGTMEKRMVTIGAQEMVTNINRDGKQVIYGILFDTDKADIKPDSKPQLDEMAALMKANPALRVFIVGHTDNQGSVEHNLGLSQRRADAVARALTTQYAIAPARMVARGLGQFAPVATNDNDDGRAKNRRVEIVKQ